MTRIAAKAGAKNSVFLNPHGLTQKGHHSTARDLAMIAAYGMKYQMFRDKVANDYYKVPSKPFPRNNSLLQTILFIINILVQMA